MATIKFRRGLAANIGAASSQAGEPFFTTDSSKLYVSDGTNKQLINSESSRYAVCGTAASTAAKTVTVEQFKLVAGEWLVVKFSSANTASSPSLNVNGLGAKPIYYRNSAITAGYLSNTRMCLLVYDGSEFEIVGDVDSDTNTTYSTLTQTLVNTGTETTGKLVTAKIIADTVKDAVSTIDGGTF